MTNLEVTGVQYSMYAHGRTIKMHPKVPFTTVQYILQTNFFLSPMRTSKYSQAQMVGDPRCRSSQLRARQFVASQMRRNGAISLAPTQPVGLPELRTSTPDGFSTRE